MSQTSRIAAVLLGLLVTMAAGACAAPVVGDRPQGVADEFVPEIEGYRVETWVEGLEVPWSLVFLPDGRALVSERPGRIRLIGADGALREQPYASLDVNARGEGGLMGLALHPDFPNEPYVYAMRTVRGGGGVTNEVVRLRHEGETASFDRVILDGIPGSRNHNGGRIAFGPDSMLYVGTGETFDAELAQDRASLGGKILRVTPEGAVPDDNPFPGSPIYSLGNRNVQGLAWHPETGDLFASEHGPSGEFGLRALDEINVIEAGQNYGWPEAVGAPGLDGYVDPLVAWPERSVPPGGIAFHDGALFVATLGSEALVRLALASEGEGYTVRGIERWFAEDGSSGRYGRLRDVTVGPDGALYVLTSNRDGRGRPQDGDDRILRLTPEG
jgi:glucose/arabinose dehydrogenase